MKHSELSVLPVAEALQTDKHEQLGRHVGQMNVSLRKIPIINAIEWFSHKSEHPV